MREDVAWEMSGDLPLNFLVAATSQMAHLGRGGSCCDGIGLVQRRRSDDDRNNTSETLVQCDGAVTVQ